MLELEIRVLLGLNWTIQKFNMLKIFTQGPTLKILENKQLKLKLR